MHLKGGLNNGFHRKKEEEFSVAYYYTDEAGNKHQKWETFETHTEALKRKKRVEYEQETGELIPPSAKTVNDLLEEYTLLKTLAKSL